MLCSVMCHPTWTSVICCNVTLDVSMDNCKGAGRKYVQTEQQKF